VIERQKLRQAMMRHFNTSELRTICFDLNVDNEDLAGTEKTTFVIEMIKFFERTNRTPELIQKCAELRPEIDFSNPNTKDNLKQELGVATKHMRPYLESQFTAYAEIWKSLQALRFAGDEIWEELTEETVKRFAKEWLNVQTMVANSAIFFTEEDYDTLRELLDAISEFRLGKLRLYDIYQEGNSRSLEWAANDAVTWARKEVVQQIRQNGMYKQHYEILLDQIGKSFRRRLAAIQ
jgi:hypothetical protein